MYSDAKELWLLDTNVLIDLIIGLNCYVAIKLLPGGSNLCSSISVRYNKIQSVIQDRNLNEKLKREISRIIKEMASSLAQKNLELIITSVTEREAYGVIRKLLDQEKRLNSSTQRGYNKWFWVLLPLDYLINYEELIKELKDAGFINIVNIENEQKEAEEVIRGVLQGRYDTRDWHLVAALINGEPTAIYTDEDSVARGLKNIVKHFGKKINIGNFGDLLVNLRTLNIFSPEQLYIISYYAYKFQRLLYSHQMVYRIALYSEPGSEEISSNALLWVVYSQCRLHHYIPIDRIIKSLY